MFLTDTTKTMNVSNVKIDVCVTNAKVSFLYKNMYATEIQRAVKVVGQPFYKRSHFPFLYIKVSWSVFSQRVYSVDNFISTSLHDLDIVATLRQCCFNVRSRRIKRGCG